MATPCTSTDGACTTCTTSSAPRSPRSRPSAPLPSGTVLATGGVHADRAVRGRCRPVLRRRAGWARARCPAPPVHLRRRGFTVGYQRGAAVTPACRAPSEFTAGVSARSSSRPTDSPTATPRCRSGRPKPCSSPCRSGHRSAVRCRDLLPADGCRAACSTWVASEEPVWRVGARPVERRVRQRAACRPLGGRGGTTVRAQLDWVGRIAQWSEKCLRAAGQRDGLDAASPRTSGPEMASGRCRSRRDRCPGSHRGADLIAQVERLAQYKLGQ